MTPPRKKKTEAEKKRDRALEVVTDIEKKLAAAMTYLPAMLRDVHEVREMLTPAAPPTEEEPLDAQ